MLMLSRRVGERIIIGDSIELVVCAARPGVVKLGVQAPRAMPVRRCEMQTAVTPPSTVQEAPTRPETQPQ